jgi:hypothetical protein
LPFRVLLGFRFLEILCQSVELFFPESPVLRDPSGCRLHGLSGEAAAVNAAVDFAVQQAGGFEDAEMLGDGGK